jgi:DNA-binding NtrC family response regulator
MNHTQKRRLWILEDEEDLRDILTTLAQRWEYDVRSFTCLQEAEHGVHELVVPQIEHPDYVVSDYSLPDGKSLRWLLKLKQILPHAIFICLSGSIDKPSRELMLKQGIHCKEKPCSLSEVFDLLRSPPVS